MAKRSRPFTDEASKHATASSKSKTGRQTSSRAGCSATAKKELTVDLRSKKRRNPMSMTRRTQGRHRATDCISQVCPGNGETCRMRFDSPMTQARRIQARNRVTDCVFQDLPGFQRSPNQKRWTWRYIVGCRKESSRVHRRHLDTTSSIIRMPKHRECSQKKMRT